MEPKEIDHLWENFDNPSMAVSGNVGPTGCYSLCIVFP